VANELATARAGLKTRLETISGLTVANYSAQPAPQFPFALIQQDGPPQLLTISGNSFKARFKVRLFLNHPGNDAEGWTELEKYLEQVGTYSITAAILADRTLNASVDFARVQGPAGAGKVALDDQGPIDYGAEWTVEVMKTVA